MDDKLCNPAHKGKKMLNRLIKALGITTLLAVGMACGIAKGTTNDAAQVVQSMREIWDALDAPLMVEPVVIEGDYALAGTLSRMWAL